MENLDLDQLTNLVPEDKQDEFKNILAALLRCCTETNRKMRKAPRAEII